MMSMQEEELVDGKVDWKGRKALKHKHGGMKVSTLILGKGLDTNQKKNMKMKNNISDTLFHTFYLKSTSICVTILFSYFLIVSKLALTWYRFMEMNQF